MKNPIPQGNYVPAIRTGDLIVTAGMTPRKDGVLINVYVNAAPDFLQHPKLADFASAYLLEELGTAGICARCALGMGTLPGDAPVEINLMAMAGPEPDSVDFGTSPYNRLRYELK